MQLYNLFIKPNSSLKIVIKEFDIHLNTITKTQVYKFVRFLETIDFFEMAISMLLKYALNIAMKNVVQWSAFFFVVRVKRLFILL